MDKKITVRDVERDLKLANNGYIVAEGLPEEYVERLDYLVEHNRAVKGTGIGFEGKIVPVYYTKEAAARRMK